MWAPTASHGSYERAGSEEHDASDATTLADEELALKVEELAMDDPLDEKSPALTSTPNVSRWRPFRRWWRRSKPPTEASGLLPERESTPTRHDPPPHRPPFVSLLIFLLPSWSHRFFGYPWPDETRRPTDYLDGLRGVASLFVFFNHYLMGGLHNYTAYSFGEGDDNWSPIQLPFIRTAFSGGAMVAIFFVISGYVLSARCIVAIREGKQDRVHSVLTSMAFRRAIRLFIPSLVISLMTLLATKLGFYHYPHHEHRATWGLLMLFRAYLLDYLFRIWTWQDVLYIFRTDDWHGWFGGQLWTIPVEFNCSMVLFVIILALARCKVAVRLVLEVFLIVYLFYVNRWDIVTFIAGMLTAELNLIMADRRKPLGFSIVLWLVLIFAWYLTGFPQVDQSHTPGYSFLSSWWVNGELMKWRFWLAISGILVVGCTSFLPAAQRAFSTCIARYLGKISYSLYLVHGLMNDLLRNPLWRALGVLAFAPYGDNPLTWNWFLATLIYVPCCLWAADIFWRLVDIPAVKFARLIEAKCFKAKAS